MTQLQDWTPKTIAVVRFGAVGDILLTAPALEALRAAVPECRIIFVTKQAFAVLIENHPAVDHVIGLGADESIGSLAARVGEQQPDALLDLHNNNRSRLLRLRVKAARKVVWTKRPWQDNIPVRLGLRPYSAKKYIAERYHDAVEELLRRSIPRGLLRSVVTAAQQEAADRTLARVGWDGASSIVGLSPGATWFTKRWPVERFAEIATRAADQGATVVVTGSPEEVELAEAILSAEPRAISLAGATPLFELAGIIQRCTAFVANDSGPMHLARSLGIPTLTFFGSTDPKQFDFTGHRALHRDLPCAPCHFYGRSHCPKGHFDCLLGISAAEAWDALGPLLSDGPAPPLHG